MNSAAAKNDIFDYKSLTPLREGISKIAYLTMEEFKNKEVILWDFDGVILESMDVRENGFRNVLSDYPDEQVESLLEYHHKNGGLSRYVKFRYFQEKVLKQQVNEEIVAEMAGKFSALMKKELTSKHRLIPEVLGFIKKSYLEYEMHIVSGSDGEELRFLAYHLGIDSYFKTIQGSPTPKISLVENILEEFKYDRKTVCLIGDSINDFEAAKENGIDFYGYNSDYLKSLDLPYIRSFSLI